MKKKSDDGGVACGICSVSLQQASLGFGIADVAHGIVGVAILMSMIIKKENDFIHEKTKLESDKMTGYTKFIKDCPTWVIAALLGTFIIQIALGMLLCIGASNRGSIICSLWIIASFLASPVTPMTYCLLGLGRVYEWATVGEWVFKMDKEELQYQVGDKVTRNDWNNDDDDDDNGDIVNLGGGGK